MQNLKKLVTPDEFINFYYSEIKNSLNTTDIQISKSGVIGFMLSLLGNMQYDIKQYYDALFNEAFPVLALDDENIFHHAETYGYKIQFATPAKLNGQMRLAVENLPVAGSYVYKKELIFQDVAVYINNMKYTLTAQYKIDIVRDNLSNYNYIANISSSDKANRIIAFTESQPFLPIVDLLQYKVETRTFQVPLYPFGTFYPITLNLNGEDIYKIIVSVDELTSDVGFIDYDTSISKSYVLPTERVVFLKKTNGSTLVVELGSGYNGKYIPRSNVKISIYTTFGSPGNIGTIDAVATEGFVHEIAYDQNNNVLYRNSNSASISSLMSFSISNGESGSNALSGEKLRSQLLKFIQSRDNLLSETDYRQIISGYFNKQEIMFKKSSLQENTINIYIPLFNRYLYPVKSATIAMLIGDFTMNMVDNKYIHYPETNINGVTYVSPFIYEFNQLSRGYDASILYIGNLIYPDNIQKVDQSYTQAPPLLYLNIEYNALDSSITLNVKSPNTLIHYNFEITAASLNILKRNMVFDLDDDTVVSYRYDSLFYNPILVTIDMFDNGIFVYSLSFKNVHIVQKLQDVMTLYQYSSGGNNVILNIPVLEKSAFLNDEKFFIDQMVYKFSNTNIQNTRLVSDNPQIRFLNTGFIPAVYNELLSVQKYDFPITLPFKVSLVLTFNKVEMFKQKLDILKQIEIIRIAVSKFLLNYKTDTQLTFFRSEIIDLVHNFNFIRGVTIEVTDDNDNIIPSGAYSTIEQNDIIKQFTKELLLNYNPPFFYWDINNIKIDYTML